MILPSRKDAIHKAWLYRVLTAVCEDAELVRTLKFKGGTCAAMRGLLDRFSVDLDFDYTGNKDGLPAARKRLEKIFKDLGLEIKDKSAKVPQYFLKYPNNKDSDRNTLKIDITFPPPAANKYETVRLTDIDRVIDCQTVETMFANKLVALIERYEKNGSIAGRDLYDIHCFFLNGQGYDSRIIKERRGNGDIGLFFKELRQFIEEQISDTIITQDLNTLLPYEKFRTIRKIVKAETLLFLADEIKRQQKKGSDGIRLRFRELRRDK